MRKLLSKYHLLQATGRKTLCLLYHRPGYWKLQSWWRSWNPQPSAHAPQGTLRLENHGEEAEDYDLNRLMQQPTSWWLHNKLHEGRSAYHDSGCHAGKPPERRPWHWRIPLHDPWLIEDSPTEWLNLKHSRKEWSEVLRTKSMKKNRGIIADISPMVIASALANLSLIRLISGGWLVFNHGQSRFR